MRTFLSIATLLLGFSLAAPAQTTNPYRGEGYFFLGPGFGNIHPGANIHIGVGGEGFIYKGLGIGAEAGALGPLSKDRLGLGWSDYVRLLGSANLSYHFLPGTTDRKTEPFLTAGYSAFVRAGISHGYNVGSGVNVWFNKKTAMRFEVRNHHSRSRETLSFRIGMTFR